MKKQTIRYSILIVPDEFPYNGFYGKNKEIRPSGKGVKAFAYFKTRKKVMAFIQGRPQYSFSLHKMYHHKPRNGRSVDIVDLGVWRSSIGNKNL